MNHSDRHDLTAPASPQASGETPAHEDALHIRLPGDSKKEERPDE